jgi:hypothetical protein
VGYRYVCLRGVYAYTCIRVTYSYVSHIRVTYAYEHTCMHTCHILYILCIRVTNYRILPFKGRILPWLGGDAKVNTGYYREGYYRLFTGYYLPENPLPGNL